MEMGRESREENVYTRLEIRRLGTSDYCLGHLGPGVACEVGIREEAQIL